MPTFVIVMRGYERQQVDELFARIDSTLGRSSLPGEPVTAADVRAVRFSSSLRGYDPRAVDEAVKQSVQELEQV